MKKYLLAISFISIVAIAKAQQTTPYETKSANMVIDTNAIYVAVEQQASFPGGITKFNKYISENLRYIDKDKDIQGRIFAAFIVERNGSLSDIKIIRGLSPEANAEVIHVLKASPKWLPGKQGGTVIREQYTVPIMFGIVKN